MCKEQHCLCLQETHRADTKTKQGQIVAEHTHSKHGSSVFVRDGLKVNNIAVCEEENVELITVELPGVVHSIYNPPPDTFRFPALEQRNKPHIVIGDLTPQYTLGIHHNKQRRRIC